MEQNDEALRLNLDLLDEKREQVLRRTEDYQRKTTRYYNQKVKPRSYMPGDLVLKKHLPRVIRPGNYELQKKEGKILHHAWNAEHLKRFYQ